MYEKLIKNYISIMTVNDIYNFAKKENIIISEKDAQTVLYYIKNYWEIVYKGNPENLFKSIKNKVSDSIYQKIIELYNQYKNKLNN